MTLAEILKDSNYKLTQFNIVEIHNIEQRIFIKQDSKAPLISSLHTAKISLFGNIVSFFI